MKRTVKLEFELGQSSLREKDLNKFKVGCVPSLNEAFEIERKVNNRSLHEIKIDEIKKIVKSIFENKK